MFVQFFEGVWHVFRTPLRWEASIDRATRGGDVQCVAACVFVFLAAPVAACASELPRDTLVVPVQLPTQFEEARALAAAPSGTLYVADAGADVVVRVSPEGAVQARLGGPGSAPGQFHDPVSVDPTNGLVLLVADAGNGRIQRFTNAFRHLETLTLGRDLGAVEAPSSTGYTGSANREARAVGFGRPVAVASTAAGEIYAIGAARGVVLRWGADRGAPRVIGGFAAGEGTLRAPTALAVMPRGRLFVADAERAAVLAYDAFGSFSGVLPTGLDASVRALAVHDRRLWIVLSGRLLVYSLRGRRLRTVRVALDAALVDATLYEDTLYLLTATGLYQTEWR